MKISLDKGIIKDFSLNIIAVLLSTGVMQLLIYPRLAITLSSEDYGVALTVIGYMNIITLSLGNNLCYARLLKQNEYSNDGIVGDFQLLLICSALIAAILIIGCSLLMKLSLLFIFGIVIATITMILKSYYVVAYRIHIDYTKNLIANLCMCIGYILGLLFFCNFVLWPWIFTFASILTLVYIWFTSNIMREPCTRTIMFKKSLKTVIFLIISGLIGNVTIYLDRFIIYPFLGGESVSIYATAAFFAKSINLMLAPTTSVLFSYLVNCKIILNKLHYLLINIALIVIGIVGVFISVTVGRYITALLYPTLIYAALPFIFYATVGIIIGAMGSFINMIVLAYAPIYWQTVIPTFKLTLYFISGLVMIKTNGIKGLCIAVIITNTLTNILSFIVGYYYIIKRRLINV